MFSLQKEDRSHELTCDLEIEFSVFRTKLWYQWTENPKEASKQANRASYMPCK